MRQRCSFLREIDAFLTQVREKFSYAVIRDRQATAKERVDCFP